MGYWQWVSVGIFVIPMVILWIVDGIIRTIYNRVKRSKVHEFVGYRMVDGIRGK